MAKICLCLTAKTIKRDLEILDKYRRFTDIAELRVDCLEPDERLQIRRFPQLAGLPVILTIRRDVDGGYFSGGEGARVSLFARGLAYADEDRRLNFAYIDIEEDLNVPSLEEATRAFGTRIIRSYYNFKGMDTDIPARIRSMRHVDDELIKVVVMAASTADVLRALEAAKDCGSQDKILICRGRFGIISRILSEQFGSFLSYASPLAETDVPPAASDQIDVRELAELYRFRQISKNTRVYGAVGFPFQAAGSLRLFNTIFGLEETDAIYVPFPADSIDDFMRLAGELDVQGLSVTAPFKEAVIPHLARQSDTVKAVNACNTMSRLTAVSPHDQTGGWLGINTDARSFSDSLLEFLGRKNLKRRKITIIGAGTAAQAVAGEVFRLGGRALILNRTTHKARRLAGPYKFLWSGLNNRGIELMNKYQDIIIQTTSAGTEESGAADPLEIYSFTGREVVMDLVYKPEITPFLKRAADAGCMTLNGCDMLIRQTRLQYAQFMGKEFPEQLLSRVLPNQQPRPEARGHGASAENTRRVEPSPRIK